MTGHRPWRELFERTFTPEERARIRQTLGRCRKRTTAAATVRLEEPPPTGKRAQASTMPKQARELPAHAP